MKKTSIFKCTSRFRNANCWRQKLSKESVGRIPQKVKQYLSSLINIIEQSEEEMSSNAITEILKDHASAAEDGADGWWVEPQKLELYAHFSQRSNPNPSDSALACFCTVYSVMTDTNNCNASGSTLMWNTNFRSSWGELHEYLINCTHQCARRRQGLTGSENSILGFLGFGVVGGLGRCGCRYF